MCDVTFSLLKVLVGNCRNLPETLHNNFVMWVLRVMVCFVGSTSLDHSRSVAELLKHHAIKQVSNKKLYGPNKKRQIAANFSFRNGFVKTIEYVFFSSFDLHRLYCVLSISVEGSTHTSQDASLYSGALVTILSIVSAYHYADLHVVTNQVIAFVYGCVVAEASPRSRSQTNTVTKLITRSRLRLMSTLPGSPLGSPTNSTKAFGSISLSSRLILWLGYVHYTRYDFV